MAIRLISIHAPREGSDLKDGEKFSGVPISIHAPREGSDHCAKDVQNALADFNPRSP